MCKTLPLSLSRARQSPKPKWWLSPVDRHRPSDTYHSSQNHGGSNVQVPLGYTFQPVSVREDSDRILYVSSYYLVLPMLMSLYTFAYILPRNQQAVVSNPCARSYVVPKVTSCNSTETSFCIFHTSRVFESPRYGLLYYLRYTVTSVQTSDISLQVEKFGLFFDLIRPTFSSDSRHLYCHPMR